MNNHPYGSPFMARGGVGRPPMPMHGGYRPGPGAPAPFMHHPRMPPMAPMHGGYTGYDYGGDYGPPQPHPRIRMPAAGGPPHRAPAPLPPPARAASPELAINPPRPATIPPKPSSTAASDWSTNSKAESLISDAEEPHNDCEILILEKKDSLNIYSEGIEQDIKDMGLTVDLMYPNADVVIKDFLLGLGKRGTNYAIVIRADNEANRSVTLHVLKPGGVAEVHRNAPLHIVYDKMREGKRTIKRNAVSRIPSEVKKALEEVVNGGLLKDSAYQKCIRYLSDRWAKQMEYEERSEYDEGTGILSEEELQRRIAKILGVNPDDVTEAGSGKLGRAVDNLLNSSSVLKTLHEQNENKLPSKHAAPDGSGTPRPKFPKAGSGAGSVSSSRSGGGSKKSGTYF